MWGEMTLAEFYYSVEGFNELEEERLKWQFFTTRRICYYVAKAAGAKDITESEIIPISELDEQIEKIRRDSLPIAEVKIDGADKSE